MKYLIAALAFYCAAASAQYGPAQVEEQRRYQQYQMDQQRQAQQYEEAQRQQFYQQRRQETLEQYQYLGRVPQYQRY